MGCPIRWVETWVDAGMQLWSSCPIIAPPCSTPLLEGWWLCWEGVEGARHHADAGSTSSAALMLCRLCSPSEGFSPRIPPGASCWKPGSCTSAACISCASSTVNSSSANIKISLRKVKSNVVVRLLGCNQPTWRGRAWVSCTRPKPWRKVGAGPRGSPVWDCTPPRLWAPAIMTACMHAAGCQPGAWSLFRVVPRNAAVCDATILNPLTQKLPTLKPWTQLYRWLL